MRVLILLITGVFTLSLVVFEHRDPTTKFKPANETQPPALAEEVEQDPEPEEWDPKTQGIGDLTEGPRFEVRESQRKPIKIVARLFTADEFAAFVKSEVAPKLKLSNSWKPKFIVLHHTGIPSIRQRPHGFTTENMYNLAHYYGMQKGWRSGPHLFVDQKGIWVFTSLNSRGTHSPSWNGVAWGIEQLGDFTKEDYTTGPGEKIRDNSLAAVAILSVAGKIDINTLHFHKEDPRTTHKSCPGPSCNKEEVLARLQSEIARWKEAWPSIGQ